MSSPLDDEPVVEGRIFHDERSARRGIVGLILAVILLYGVASYIAWLVITAT